MATVTKSLSEEEVTTAKVNGSVVNGVVPVLTSSKELKVVFVLGMFYSHLVHMCVYTQEEDSCYPVSK
jgi:hypothetical protein